MKNILLILLILLTLGCDTKKFGFNTEDITSVYSSYVTEWQSQAKRAFDKAEQSVLKNPQPKPDEILKPDQDPKKCICKGTGIIVHGDGHKTACPFHFKNLR